MKRLPLITLAVVSVACAATLWANIPNKMMQNFIAAAQPSGTMTVDYSPPTVGLMAHYKFDNSAKDEISTSNATWTGTARYDADVPSKLSTYNGYTYSAKTTNGSYMLAYNATLLNNATGCTFAIWIKDRVHIDYPGLIYANTSGGALGINAYSPVGKPWFVVDGVGIAVSTAMYSTNQWTHLAMTWAISNKPIVYLNGVAFVTGVTAKATAITQNVAFGMGQDAASPGFRFWDGWLNQGLVYSRPLTPQEIYFLATGTAGPP